jgi:hypothetical protein
MCSRALYVGSVFRMRRLAQLWRVWIVFTGYISTGTKSVDVGSVHVLLPPVLQARPFSLRVTL